MVKIIQSAGHAVSATSTFAGVHPAFEFAQYVAALTPEELFHRYIAVHLGLELPDNGLLRVDEFSDAQVHRTCELLDGLEAGFRAKPARGSLQ